jgi:hypothetical protein
MQRVGAAALIIDDAEDRVLLVRHIYGDVFVRRVKGLGISEILLAPRAPWQNPFAERVIGSIRRECLDHVIVINERHVAVRRADTMGENRGGM